MACTNRPSTWDEIKDKIDLDTTATALMGPASKRAGRSLLWRCPWHDDHHPSLHVDPAKGRWKCWPCDLGGDAMELVRRLHPGWSFRERGYFSPRVEPPVGKDGTEAAQYGVELGHDGVNLRRWRIERLAGTLAPELFTWEEQSTWRWIGRIGRAGRPALVPERFHLGCHS